MSNKSDTEVSIKEAYENAASLLESGEIDLAEYQLSEILKKFRIDLAKGERNNHPCKNCNAFGLMHGSKHFEAWGKYYNLN